MKSEMSRREAIKTSLAAGIVACGAAGCQPEPEPIAGPSQAQPLGVAAKAGAGGTFTVPAGNLESAGQVLVTLPDQRAVMIFRTKAGELGAVTAKCSHQGCALSFDREVSLFNCPCHGSQFNTGGKVVKGPATAPITKFSVEINGSDAILKS